MEFEAPIYAESQAASTTLYEELLYRISWNSDKWVWRSYGV